MVAVAVVAVIVAALLLVLLARTVVTLTYSDDFLVVLKILFIKIQLFPKKTKKPPTRLTKKQLLRLEKKKAKKAAKKAEKKSKKQGGGETSGGEKSNKKSKKLGIVETLTVIKDIFASVAPKLAKYLNTFEGFSCLAFLGPAPATSPESAIDEIAFIFIRQKAKDTINRFFHGY